jgi:hypothetical protein
MWGVLEAVTIAMQRLDLVYPNVFRAVEEEN